MGECKECEKKDRTIRILHTQSEGYRHDAELWKKNLEVVRSALDKIIGMLKDLKWYPSDYKTRGDTGITLQEQGWCDVQSGRDNPVEDPTEQIEIDRMRSNR